MITTPDIRDGLSNVVLMGEKIVHPDRYLTGDGSGDKDTMYGQSTVNLRALTNPLLPDWLYASVLPGYVFYSFGSAHGAGANFAFCDGSVRMIHYDADPTILGQLGKRDDGLPIGDGGI